MSCSATIAPRQAGSDGVSASTTRALNLRSLPTIDIATLPGRVAHASRISMAQAEPVVPESPEL